MHGRHIENTKIFDEIGKVFMKLKVESAESKVCILQNKISEIDKFKEVIREIDLNADRTLKIQHHSGSHGRVPVA